MLFRSPILDGKVLDGNVTSTISRLTGIDHFDGRIIVAVQDGRTRLAKIQLREDCTKVQGSFGGGDRSKEFSFGRTCGCNGLSFRLIGDCTAGQKKSKTSGRTSLTQVIGMGSVDETHKSGKRSLREERERGRVGRRREHRVGRQGGARSRAAEANSP